jgi:Family of unknown function (DUF6282)
MPDYSEIDLTGTIDMHVHSAPDVWPRKLDDLELAHQAAQRGMRAILLKSHWTLTADRAYLIEKVVPGIRFFGGLALNEAVGGFNPAAVEVALKMGAAEIWMPTISAAGEEDGSLTLLKDGKVREEVFIILKLIADKDAILGTGHLSTEEIVTLIPIARSLGVRKILITHPEHPPVMMPPAQQEALRDRYRVFFERCLITTVFGGGPLPFEALAGVIRRVGPESTVISTDFGQIQNPSPVDGFACFISSLLQNGFSKAEVSRMSRENPAHLLGLPL